jgi:hypothetical protein
MKANRYAPSIFNLDTDGNVSLNVPHSFQSAMAVKFRYIKIKHIERRNNGDIHF